MKLVRRAFLLLLLVAALPAAAREAPYLTARDLDLVGVLPPPIASGSPADREQLAVVLAAQRGAAPERIAQARADADEAVFAMFGAVLGPNFNAPALPATARLFERLGRTEGVLVGPAKKAFGRTRPYLVDPQIKALAGHSTSGSYPSGHTSRVNLAAIVLGDLVPEQRAAIWARARDYAWSRVIGGVHYPNDLDGGARAGTAIAIAVRSRPEFTADFEAARRELRSALGLQP